MVPHIMKTTVEITDDLLVKAKALAAKNRTTLKNLIEEGLRQVFKNEQSSTDFELPDARVDGDGLQPEFQDSSWEQIRAAIYEGRGG